MLKYSVLVRGHLATRSYTMPVMVIEWSCEVLSPKTKRARQQLKAKRGLGLLRAKALQVGQAATYLMTAGEDKRHREAYSHATSDGDDRVYTG